MNPHEKVVVDERRRYTDSLRAKIGRNEKLTKGEEAALEDERREKRRR